MKKTDNNKSILYLVVLILLVIIGLYLKSSKTNTTTIEQNPTEQIKETTNPINITTKDIKEKNFSGKVAVISGSSLLATTAQKYIDKTVADFKKEADNDVPDMREKFGADSPTAQYEIDIEAREINSEKTQSIIISEYIYTGGANGNSLYKSINVSKTTGSIISLSEIIKRDKQTIFINLVKKELLNWKPDGSKESMSFIFEDAVKSLNFTNFSNWTLDDQNLTIYFDKYAIGVGALGPVAFPLSIDKIKDFLQ